METKVVESITKTLPIRKDCIKKLPRKIKKKLKKIYGKQGYINWLNEPVKWVVGEPKFRFFIDAEKLLTEILIEELKPLENGN
jgi:hypothetical protein